MVAQLLAPIYLTLSTISTQMDSVSHVIQVVRHAQILIAILVPHVKLRQFERCRRLSMYFAFNRNGKLRPLFGL